jgi:hypothetical protein
VTDRDLDLLGAELAALLNDDGNGGDLGYAEHLGDGVLDSGWSRRRLDTKLRGEVRILIEVDGDTPTAVVATLWYDEAGEPVEDECHAEGLALGDVAGIRAAVDAALGGAQ